MTPVYFPFTYLPKPVSESLAACFDALILYRVLPDGAVPKGIGTPQPNAPAQLRMIHRSPAEENAETIVSLKKAYLQWARTHEGDALTYLNRRQGNAPFYDETSAHEIRSEIRRQVSGAAQPSEPHPLLDAQIFLSMAESYDADFWEMTSGFTAVDRMERMLMENLRPDGALAEDADHFGIGKGASGGAETEDPGSRMTRARIRSWSAVARLDDQIPDLWVTTSRAVIDQIMEVLPGMREAGRLPGGVGRDDATAFRDGVQRLLAASSGQDAPSGTDEPGAGDGWITLFELSGFSGRMLADHLAAPHPPGERDGRRSDPEQSVRIVLVESVWG